jgi:hypothetical protein
MTLVVSHLEALIAARVGATGARLSIRELIKPLERFAPTDLTLAAWRDRLAEIVSDLRAREILDAKHRLRDDGELARRIGRYRARTWKQLSERVLPGLALGIAADDGKAHAPLAGRDAWAAAIAGRVLALWHDGPPPSLGALCDALVWRELGLSGKPKRCPPEIRGVFLQRQFHGEVGSPKRLVCLLAAREAGAFSSELQALRDALMRSWLAGRLIGASGASRPATSEAPGATGPTHGGSARPAADEDLHADSATHDGPPRHSVRVAGAASAASAETATHDAAPGAFAHDVLRAVETTHDGWFGDRKVFVSAVWHELCRSPVWSGLSLDEFKVRLVAAHRAGALVLARADFVAAMDPELVAASEIVAEGASFHFLVKEPVT